MMRVFLFMAMLTLPFQVFAQAASYNFSKLDIYSGLSHNQVTAILKDTEGYLWFSTVSGLNRYDGHTCKILRNRQNDSTSLADNYVLSLYELPEEKIWVATKGGPCIYDAHTERFHLDCGGYLKSIGLEDSPMYNITKGYNGRYWFLYENGSLFLYTNKQAKKITINLADKIIAVRETAAGKLWLLHRNGALQEYDILSGKTTFTSTILQQQAKGHTPTNLFIDSDSDIWLWSFAYGAYLFHPQDNSVRIFNENSSPAKLQSSLVSQVVQDNNGMIWIATDHGGITLIDKKKNFHTSYLLNDPKNPQSLSQNSINVLYKDDNGILWAGTYKQGVNYLNSNILRFPHYHHQESDARSLPYDDVNRFVEDRLGNLWIGTNGGGLIYFDRKHNTFRQYRHDPGNPNTISNNVIVSLWIDHQNILWIGTYFGGLNSFDGKKFTRYQHSDQDASSLADDKVWEIYEDKDRQLWIGTWGSGVDLFDRKTGRFTHFYREKTGNQSSNYISAMMDDSKGNLWTGTTYGVMVFSRDKKLVATYRHTSGKKSLSSNNVICFLEDSKGRVWVGTHEGLNLFNEQTGDFELFTMADGLPDNIILNILEDNRQRLWLSTPSGLCSVMPHLKGNCLSLSVAGYDESNNLQNREFNENAALKTSTGELVFGGPSGFNIINTSLTPKTVDHSKLIFTGLQILNTNIKPGEILNGRIVLGQSLRKLKSINLKYRENVFSIEFASLDYGHKAHYRYAYTLEGFNTDWLHADGDQRKATYTNLDPRNYTFKVKALNSDGSWGEPISLKIHVEPPFWRTSLAFVIYLLTATGLLLLARRITLDRIHMRYEVEQQRREAERAHAIEQVKTKFFTNVSHELRTPLSLIISPLDTIIKNTDDEVRRKQLGLVLRNAKRLLNLVNQLLDFRKMEVEAIRLHLAMGDIVQFIRDISQSFTDIAEKKKITFNFTSAIDNLEIYFDKDKIEKILFNLLSNAFKYTPDNGVITLHLSCDQPSGSEDNAMLVIEVQDTGIGIPENQQQKIFERFFQTDVPADMANQGTGIGLAITKEFVKLHHGVITVKSAPGHGTRFTVRIPAKKICDTAMRSTTPLITEEDATQMLSEETRKNGKMKTILLVEDNEDLRFYLKDNLRSKYHIEEATNGQEGWEKVKRCNPDLIVSDIMMPLLDGIDLVKNIRTETETAHIPVILLTAVGDESRQLQAFSAGANDYIIKPFTFEILDSRIKNLLAQQKLLQKRFQKQIEVNPAEITVTSVDETFLQHALDVIEKQMDNPDFSVEDFSAAMYMNRVTLYRKILALTGRSPLEFIRSIRLKRAAQLLEKSGMTVAEIAYKVGFNNPKQFSKCFKEEFKVLPSQYAIRKKETDS
ncbi:MAG TPA: two-component regulator propeller domain-containing protein [Chitinophaga sp.]|uniref:hybrid sensor histidine kinase/response regulator transcription factor n=1 Tax=Chitinophaga sp. TaxID=1869181 RepID=UPI002CB8BEE3|nr:two-component regulator propeller domain-containing protein [Chitinophaga sp.]HVI44666.1 two-component regulator propeller domain-containing protein [Chitinophaga sp.]